MRLTHGIIDRNVINQARKRSRNRIHKNHTLNIDIKTNGMQSTSQPFCSKLPPPLIRFNRMASITLSAKSPNDEKDETRGKKDGRSSQIIVSSMLDFDDSPMTTDKIKRFRTQAHISMS